MMASQLGLVQGDVEVLLQALCEGIEQPPRKPGAGRKPHLLCDAVFAAVMKVYTTLSGRRASTDIERCEERGHLDRAVHCSSVFRTMEDPATTPILVRLIEEAAAPLAVIENAAGQFAQDSTGFSTVTYDRWFDQAHGKLRAEHAWVKLHVMVGTVTNVVTGVRRSYGSSGTSSSQRSSGARRASTRTTASRQPRASVTVRSTTCTRSSSRKTTTRRSDRMPWSAPSRSSRSPPSRSPRSWQSQRARIPHFCGESRTNSSRSSRTIEARDDHSPSSGFEPDEVRRRSLHVVQGVLAKMKLTYKEHGIGSVFSCITRDAESDWPDFLNAWLGTRAPSLGTHLVGVTNPDGDAMAKIRGFWLTHDGRWDPSNRRMPYLVLPAARALAILRHRAPSISSERIVELYGEGYGSPRFEDLRALLTAFGVVDPGALDNADGQPPRAGPR